MTTQKLQPQQLHQILQLNTRLTGYDTETVLLDEAVSGICRILDLVDVTIFEWQEPQWWIRTTTSGTLNAGKDIPADLTEALTQLSETNSTEQFVETLTEQSEINGRITSPLFVANSLFGAVISHTAPKHNLEEIGLLVQTFSGNLAILWQKLTQLLETQQRAKELELLQGRQLESIWKANSAMLEARYENRVLQFERRSGESPSPDQEEYSDGDAGFPDSTIPLIVGNRPIGELSLPANLNLEEEDIDFVETLVREMGNALNNAQLLQTTRSYSAQLQVAADVSRAANTILERNVLIRRVVDLVQESFDLYYVGLFLVDENDDAVLMAGTGEAGKIQVEQGHKLHVGGESMIGKAISSDNAIVEQDVTQAANWRPNPYLPETRSELALALRTRGRTIGALTVQSTELGNFTEENITVLQTVADQMATAIENASLFAKTEERMAEWRLLFNITQAAASSIDSQERIENVVEALFNNLGQVDVTLMIANDTTQQLEVIAARGSQQNQTLFSYHEGLPGQAVQLGQPMMINDIRELPDFKTGYQGSLAQLVVPLNLGGRTIGLIDVQSQQVDAFSEQDLRLLQSLSVSLAATIQTGRLIEDIQEANSRLRELDQLKTQFLANMSHELRTPLNSIIGFSRVILKGIDGPITNEQEEDLTSIYTSGQHLLSLINDILDVARIEAGKMTLAYEFINIAEMANSVHATVRGLVKDKDIELDWQIEEGLPLIEADSMRLRQILLNFLSNAAKFTEKGRITLHIFQDAPDQIHIAIEDTGIGIAEEDFDVLFEAFEQVDSSATRVFGGTGLGLPITKKLIELHQGHVWAESEVDVGTTFHVTLPIYQNPTDNEPFDIRQTRDQQNGRQSTIDDRPAILVVDDEPGMVNLYERYLRGRPYQILRAKSGLEALQAIREYEDFIQLVLLDINMPGLNGWDVLKEMNDNPDIEDIPVIVCSIENEPDKATALGAKQTLLKPFIEDDLLQALQEIGLND